VKRLFALTLAGSVASVLLLANSGSAQTPVPDIDRGSPALVTATVTPHRDRRRPFTFTTTGRMIPPPRYCTPGVSPGPGAANCVPILCAPGVTDPRYCLKPGRSVICSGSVAVRYQKHTTTISTRIVRLTSACTYRSRVSFRLRTAERRGALRVRARFLGNPVLLPRNSATHTVFAG
jgi:hypothetical protein